MKKSKSLALNAVFLALTILFTTLPIQIGLFKLALLMLIPTIIAGQLISIKSSIFIGLCLGIVGCLMHWIAPSSILSFAFRHPLVSVLPRLLVGVVSGGASYLLNKIIKSKSYFAQFSKSVITTALSVLTNTFFVVATLILLYNGHSVNGIVITLPWMLGLVSVNFIIEICVLSAICPPLVIGLKKGLKLDFIKPKSSNTNINVSVNVNVSNN